MRRCEVSSLVSVVFYLHTELINERFPAGVAPTNTLSVTEVTSMSNSLTGILEEAKCDQNELISLKKNQEELVRFHKRAFRSYLKVETTSSVHGKDLKVRKTILIKSM